MAVRLLAIMILALLIAVPRVAHGAAAQLNVKVRIISYEDYIRQQDEQAGLSERALFNRHMYDTLFERLDLDGDGRISRDEFTARVRLRHAAQIFEQLDHDGTGMLSRQDLAGYGDAVRSAAR